MTNVAKIFICSSGNKVFLVGVIFIESSEQENGFATKEKSRLQVDVFVTLM